MDALVDPDVGVGEEAETFRIRFLPMPCNAHSRSQDFAKLGEGVRSGNVFLFFPIHVIPKRRHVQYLISKQGDLLTN